MNSSATTYPHESWDIVKGSYSIDNQTQGFWFSSKANKGRLVSLIEIPLHPIRYVADTTLTLAFSALVTVTSAICLVATSIFQVLSSLFALCRIHASSYKFLKEMQSLTQDLFEIQCFVISQGIFTTLTAFPIKTMRFIGNIAGIFLPEIGKVLRTSNRTIYEKTFTGINYKENISPQLFTFLTERIEDIYNDFLKIRETT